MDKNALNTSEIILDMVNELLKLKYSNIVFYCHNLGGYDIVFILKVLYTYNHSHEDKYAIYCVLRDDKIIKVTTGKAKYSFNIVDSYCMLTDKLVVLGESFEVETVKSIFPYKFSTENHLFYVGSSPDIK